MISHSKSGLRFVSLLTTLTLITATSLNAAPGDTASIIDGTQSPASTFPSVTPIRVGGDSICTGTLVGPRHVLTAAHCMFGNNNQRAVGDTDITVDFNGQSYQSSLVSVHPAYVSRNEACVQDEFDAAVVTLSEDVTGVTPTFLGRTTPTVGTELLLVGYGLIGNGATGQGDSGPPDGIVVSGATSIETVNNTYIEWTFDQGESNTASGDSGGPSFATINSETRLVGITCGGFGNAEIGTDSSNTRVDQIAGWIDAITGTPETPTAPSLLGPQRIQARVGVAFATTLFFTGSAPTSVSAVGLPAGVTLNGNVISGTPEAAGSTTVTITAGNDLGSNTGTLVINVTGFTPSVSVNSVTLKFTGNNRRDFFRARGVISVPANFKPKGKVAIIKVGRSEKRCRLDSDFGCGRVDYFELTGKSSDGKLKTRRPRYEFQLITPALLQELGVLGFTVNPADGTLVSVPVEVTINNVRSSTTVTLRYRARTQTWVKN
jgi:hypothetical protein